jgi:hypothetical protein
MVRGGNIQLDRQDELLGLGFLAYHSNRCHSPAPDPFALLTVGTRHFGAAEKGRTFKEVIVPFIFTVTPTFRNSKSSACTSAPEPDLKDVRNGPSLHEKHLDIWTEPPKRQPEEENFIYLTSRTW